MKALAVLVACLGCVRASSTAPRVDASRAWVAAEQPRWDERSEALPASLPRSTLLLDDSTRMLVAQRCGSPDVWVVPDLVIVRFWPAATDRQRMDAMRSVQAKAVVFLPIGRGTREGIHLLWIRPSGR